MHNPLLLTLPTRMPLPHFCVSGWVLSPKSPVVIHIARLYPFNLIPQPVLTVNLTSSQPTYTIVQSNSTENEETNVRALRELLVKQSDYPEAVGALREFDAAQTSRSITFGQSRQRWDACFADTVCMDY